jgi:putative endonuclease
VSDPRHDIGRRAEDAVAAWLTDAGWRVLARRWRCPQGELDLVCLDRAGTLVGIEVRARRGQRTGSPEESLGPRLLGRRRAALGAFALERRPRHAGRRLDLVAVTPIASDPARRWRLRRVAGIDAW